jgi:hypothetical protein
MGCTSHGLALQWAGSAIVSPGNRLAFPLPGPAVGLPGLGLGQLWAGRSMGKSRYSAHWLGRPWTGKSKGGLTMGSVRKELARTWAGLALAWLCHGLARPWAVPGMGSPRHLLAWKWSCPAMVCPDHGLANHGMDRHGVGRQWVLSAIVSNGNRPAAPLTGPVVGWSDHGMAVPMVGLDMGLTRHGLARAWAGHEIPSIFWNGLGLCRAWAGQPWARSAKVLAERGPVWLWHGSALGCPCHGLPDPPWVGPARVGPIMGWPAHGLALLWDGRAMGWAGNRIARP